MSCYLPSGQRRPILDVRSNNLVYLENVPNNIPMKEIKWMLQKRCGRVKFIETFEAWTSGKKIGQLVIDFDSGSAVTLFSKLLSRREILNFGPPVEFTLMNPKNRDHFFDRIRRRSQVDLLACGGIPPTFDYKQKNPPASVREPSARFSTEFNRNGPNVENGKHGSEARKQVDREKTKNGTQNGFGSTNGRRVPGGMGNSVFGGESRPDIDGEKSSKSSHERFELSRVDEAFTEAHESDADTQKMLQTAEKTVMDKCTDLNSDSTEKMNGKDKATEEEQDQIEEFEPELDDVFDADQTQNSCTAGSSFEERFSKYRSPARSLTNSDSSVGQNGCEVMGVKLTNLKPGFSLEAIVEMLQPASDAEHYEVVNKTTALVTFLYPTDTVSLMCALRSNEYLVGPNAKMEMLWTL